MAGMLPKPAARPASQPCTSSQAQQGGETPGTPAEFLREATLGRAAPGTEPNPIWAWVDPPLSPRPGNRTGCGAHGTEGPDPPGTWSASPPKGQGSQEFTVPRHPRRPQPRRGLSLPLRPPTKLGASTAGPRAPAPPSPRPRTGSARPRPAHSPAPAPGWAHRRLPAPLRVHTRGTGQKRALVWSGPNGRNLRRAQAGSRAAPQISRTLAGGGGAGARSPAGEQRGAGMGPRASWVSGDRSAGEGPGRAT